MKHQKPLVGISQCLLGDRVRYDGDSKPLTMEVLTLLQDKLELVPVCPEVEAGLGIPRPPVQLTGSIKNPQITGRDDPAFNVTEQLMTYCNHKPVALKHLKGFIFKSRSPSCGFNSTPVFINGESVIDTSWGVFARAFCTTYPDLPYTEETSLVDITATEKFIRSVLEQ